MYFQSNLDAKLSSASILNIESEDSFHASVLAEDDRSKLVRILAIVKKLLFFDIKSLFRFAETGGEMTESTIVINDLYLDIIKEAVDAINIRTVLQGNYFKIIELRVKANVGGLSSVYIGYMIERLTVDNEKIQQYLTTTLADWNIGMPIPFRWFRTINDATNELEIEERKLATLPPRKPVLEKPPKDVDIQNVAIAVSKHLKRPDIADTILQLDKNQLMKIAQEGKKATKGMSAWDIGKKIFLVYLALGALVTGPAGIAALLIGLLIVWGVDKSKKKKIDKGIDQETQFKELVDKATRGELSPDETKQFERMRATKIQAMRTKADLALRGELPQ